MLRLVMSSLTLLVLFAYALPLEWEDRFQESYFVSVPCSKHLGSLESARSGKGEGQGIFRGIRVVEPRDLPASSTSNVWFASLKPLDRASRGGSGGRVRQTHGLIPREV